MKTQGTALVSYRPGLALMAYLVHWDIIVLFYSSSVSSLLLPVTPVTCYCATAHSQTPTVTPHPP